MKREDLKKAFELNKEIEDLQSRIKKARRRISEGSEINLYSIEENFSGDTYKDLIFGSITNAELNLIIQCRESRIAELEKELEGIL